MHQDKIVIKSPLVGKIIFLNEIEDVTFSKHVLGKTIGISPIEEIIYEPLMY